MPTIISTAFPKEALRRPASVWPRLNDICSVESPRSYLDRRMETPKDKGQTGQGREGNANRDLGKGHDSEEAERKAQSGIPVEVVGDDAERDEDKEDVEVRLEEVPAEGLGPGGLAVGLDEADDARAEADVDLVGVCAGDERGSLRGRHGEGVCIAMGDLAYFKYCGPREAVHSYVRHVAATSSAFISSAAEVRCAVSAYVTSVPLSFASTSIIVTDAFTHFPTRTPGAHCTSPLASSPRTSDVISPPCDVTSTFRVSLLSTCPRIRVFHQSTPRFTKSLFVSAPFAFNAPSSFKRLPSSAPMN
jgi:hypothetical protein